MGMASSATNSTWLSLRDCGLVVVGVAAGIAISKHLCWRDLAPRAPSEATRLAGKKADNPEILREQLSRNVLFLGEDGQRLVANSFVVVVGLGGVGSHAAHMLARSGVGRMRLVDFDRVSVSSLNRHAVATRNDVGLPKVEVCAGRFNDFAPGCNIEAVDCMFSADTASSILDGSPDFVIDCIDDVETKADLLEACQGRNIEVISAFGAGGKCDPTRILIGDLSDPVKDALAMKLRKNLYYRALETSHAKKLGDSEQLQPRKPGRKGNLARTKEADGYLHGIHVVYSYEKSNAKLADLDEDQVESPDSFGAVPNFRIRTMPVIGHMPAIFGMMAAGFVISKLADKPFQPKQVELISSNFRTKQHLRLVQREKKVFSNDPKKPGATPIADEADVTHVIEDIWLTRSCFNETRTEYHGLALTRFDRSKPALPYNLILVEPREADQHDKETAVTGTVPADINVRPRLLFIQSKLLELENIWQSEKFDFNAYKTS